MSLRESKLPEFSINGNEIDPNSPRFQAIDAARTNYIIIQRRHPLTSDELGELQQLQVEIQGAVAHNTLLCKYKPTDIEVVRQCPFLQYVDVYRNVCVITPALRQNIPSFTGPSSAIGNDPSTLLETSPDPSAADTAVDIDILLHKDFATNNDAVLTHISTISGVSRPSMQIAPYLIHLTTSLDKLETLAKLDEVARIEEVMPMKTNDAYAERIMHADTVLNTTGLTGRGQIIAVADTGFDNGTIANCHPAFVGKIAKLISVWRKDQVNDPYNHGTHVCGSIVAEGQSLVTHEKIRGIAPGAKLVVQSLCTTEHEVVPIKRPRDLIALFDTARKDCKAGVHTNSWGPDWSLRTGQKDYTIECSVIDAYIRQNPSLVVCWSAGNEGERGVATPGQGQIGSYAASKNVITVGSTVSDRPFTPQLSYDQASVAAIQQGINVNAVAYNSSCGPTRLDGRIKPDVVAPGVRILSTTSQDLGWQHQLREDDLRDRFWETMSGTSMATPQVAGCIAIIKQALEDHKVDKRFAEADVIKALLINGAVSLTRTPNFAEGFGRVNLENSMIIPGLTAYAGIFTHDGLSTSQVAKFTIDVPTIAEMSATTARKTPNPTTTVNLTATLVYLDHESQVLVNQLRFVIIASNGMECHGNNSPGVAEFDTVNNVQRIVWIGITPGPAEIIVTAHNILMPGDKQSCAVVWRISV